jgi:hypothetical protein
VINAFRGFSIDGNTQAQFNSTVGLKGIDSVIYIVGSAHPVSYPVFNVHEQTDSSAFANFVMEDAGTGIKLRNNSDKITGISFRISEAVKGDTAIILTGNGNHLIKNASISGYKKGVHMTAQTSGNTVQYSEFSHVDIGILIDGNSKENKADKNHINADSIGVMLNGVNQVNYIVRNTFGSLAHPVTVTSVKLHNAALQYVGFNSIPAGRSVNPDSLIAFIELADSCKDNQIMNNRIGITDSGFTRFRSEMIGVRVKPATAGLTNTNNIISGNQIAGLKVPAIIIENSDGGSVQANFVGVDSAFVQREAEENYSKVSGIDSTAIILESSDYVTVNANTIVNFGVYALDVRKSEGVTITANKMFSEKSKLKGINLNLDSAALVSNSGIKAPVIDSTEVIGSDKIVLRGNTLYPNSKVQIFEGFAHLDDTLDHSLRFIKTVDADADGNFAIELPSSNFGFNKYNKYIAQVSYADNSSEFSHLYTVKSLLCKLHERGIDLLAPSFNPCPKSDFKMDAVLDGLIYKWSSPQMKDTIRTRIAAVDSSAFVTLEISDQFGCKHTETIDVVYKMKPVQPEFIVSSSNYVGDTIVLIDVAQPVPTSYDWNSSDAITIVYSGDAGSGIKGPDGKIYPAGREVRFIVPDTGVYTIEQRSLREGCFVKLTKDVKASFKDPGHKDPYALSPGINDLIVYPSPATKGSKVNAFIKTTTKDEVELEVLDIETGTTLFNSVISGKLNYNVPVDVSNLSAGTYLVRLKTSSSNITYKLVIQ